MDMLTATHLAAYLAPALPFLTKGGEEAVKEAGKKLGAAVWEQVSGLWKLLKPKVDERPTALEAVEDLARDPELEPARTALAWQLEKILQADPGLQAELAKLLQASGGTQTCQAFLHGDGAIAQGGSVAAGKGGIAIGGDVEGGVKLVSR